MSWDFLGKVKKKEREKNISKAVVEMSPAFLIYKLYKKFKNL